MSKMIFRKTALALALLAGAGVSLSSQASIIGGLAVDGVNTLQDSNAERVIGCRTVDGAEVCGVVSDGDIQVGDVIQSILRWETMNSVTFNVAAGNLYYQATGYSELEVAALTNERVVDGITLVDIIFKPTGNLQHADSFVDLYEFNGADTNPPAVNFGNTAAVSISNIQNQTLVASIGLGSSFVLNDYLSGNFDDYWFATAPKNLGVLASLGPQSAQAGSGVFGLSTLSNPGAIPVAPDGIEGLYDDFHAWVGNSGVYQCETGTNCTSGTGWDFSSNTSASFLKVPEPGSLALLGLGLVGLVGANRRKKV